MAHMSFISFVVVLPNPLVLGVEPGNVAAVATEVFRKARNGEEYLAKIKEDLGLGNINYA